MIEKPNPFPFTVPLKLVSQPIRYEPVGHCIYCGTNTDKLQLEHIIPFGIAGNAMLLPKASCRSCAKITATIEQHCLRHLWWPFRTRIGAPTGQPKERPEAFTLRTVRNDSKLTMFPSDKIDRIKSLKTSKIKADEYPAVLLSLLLPLPGILAGRAPTPNFEGQFWYSWLKNETHLIENEKEAMLLGPINPNTFARMLAKIAHAYAVAQNSYRFRPLLRDLILGRTDTANYWVGGELEIPPLAAEPILHDIRARRCTVNRQRTYFVVDIQLFAFMQTPLYHVVVGEIEGAVN